MGSNGGSPIDQWRKSFGIDSPVPWCAIFCSVKSREGKVVAPVVWSARARDFAVKGHSWTIADVIYHRYVPRPGDYRVKTRRGGNHVDVFIDWDPKTQRGHVIGGNVADRVLIRKISIQRMIADGTTHVTEVTGCAVYPRKQLDAVAAVLDGIRGRTAAAGTTTRSTRKRAERHSAVVRRRPGATVRSGKQATTGKSPGKSGISPSCEKES